MSASVHFLATIIWGSYGIIVGALAILYGYTSDLVWVSVWVAVVGNSAHLVTFAWSQKNGVSISAQGSTATDNVTGRSVVNSAGQVVGTIK